MGVDTTNFENKILQSRKPETVISSATFPKNFTLAEYLEKLLADKNLERREVIKKSQLNQVTTQHIFEGRTKEPARLRLIALALAMELNAEETEKLLIYGNAAKIYPRRNEWEAIIFLAINKNWSVTKTNDELHNAGQTPLLGDIS